MKTLRRCLLSLALGLLTIQPVSAGEPGYAGKPLSEWMFRLVVKRSGHDLENVPATDPEPEDAITAIGTNAIPTLLKIVGASGKHWTLWRLKSHNFRAYYSKGPTLNDLKELGADTLGLLGTNAQPAIPQLAKLLHKTDNCESAARALVQIGPAGLAVLTNALSDKNSDVRGAVILTVSGLGKLDVDSVTRFLIAALNDSDPVNRGNAAMNLANKSPTLAIPALMKLLDEKEYYVVANVVRSLASYGAKAKAAAPRIFEIYTNSVAQRDLGAATTWGVALLGPLASLDPGAAVKAETFLVNSGPLNYARIGYSITKLQGGQEMIAGGMLHTNFPSAGNRYLSEVELYDPTTGKWSETGKMNYARLGHTATLQPDGKVLVEGGQGPGARGSPPVLSIKELYDPGTGQWSVIQNK